MQDIEKGKTKQVQGKARAEIGKIKGDKVEQVKGKEEQVSGKLQEEYGKLKKKAHDKTE